MIRKSLSKENKTSVSIAANIVGDVWSILIIKELLDKKTLRFNEIQDLVADICPRTLSQRLDKLRQQGVVNKEMITHGQTFTQYTLTNTGEKILPVINAISDFGHFIDQTSNLEINEQ